MIIRIDTIIGMATIKGQSARTARAVARAWLKRAGCDMGGGSTARVSVGVPGGRWHYLGEVGNPSDRPWR